MQERILIYPHSHANVNKNKGYSHQNDDKRTHFHSHQPRSMSYRTLLNCFYLFALDLSKKQGLGNQIFSKVEKELVPSMSIKFL